MGFLTSLMRSEKRDINSTLLELGFGQQSRTGVQVTPTSALSMAAVWACVRVVAESVAGLPLLTYRRRGDGGKERAVDHPLYGILHDVANPEMSAFELRELLASHVETWGNAYANIEWSPAGYPQALWPLNPANMERADRINGDLVYFYRAPDQTLRRLTATEVLHIRGLGSDGVFGYSPVRMHMEAIGLGIATERYGATFFGNGARPGGLLTHPGRLSEEAYRNLKASFGAEHGGLENAHRMKILEEGMSYTAIGIPPEEAQFLGTRNFQVGEMARIFRIPPHMIQDLSRATFSNIEHQSIDFVVHSLRPRLVRFEQAYQRQLLTTAERRSYFVEHLVDGLLRGDITSRYAAYNTAIQAGFMNRNEVRGLENLNPAEDLDAYLVPLNMMEAGAAMPAPAAPAAAAAATAAPDPARSEEAAMEIRAQSAAADRRAIANSQEAVVVDAMERIVRRETNDIGRAVTKYLVRANDVAGFLVWLDGFYREHPEFVRRNLKSGFEATARLTLMSVSRELGDDMLPHVDALMLFVAEYLEAMANRWAAGNAAQLRAIVGEGAVAGAEEIAAAVQERLAGWEETEAQKNARRETYRGVNAFAYALYGESGVSYLRWVATGENCPYCNALNGKIVGMNQSFVGAGDFKPLGAAGPLRIRNQRKHAPLHAGCDCMVIASR